MIYVLHNENAGMFINKCLPSVNVLLTQLELPEDQTFLLTHRPIPKCLGIGLYQNKMVNAL